MVAHLRSRFVTIAPTIDHRIYHDYTPYYSLSFFVSSSRMEVLEGNRFAILSIIMFWRQA
jgi:hypothetical protein